MNLGRDVLRRRKRRAYVGPWLPSPIETGADAAPPSFEAELASGATTEGRYDLVESVSMAFLLALEALSPKQRAVLLLRDVFEYAVADAAWALDVSESDVKVTHHRARAALADYDRARCIPTPDLQQKTRDAIDTLMTALATGDMRGAEKLLADSVVAVSDGGGEFFAARVPILGRERVFKFYSNIATKRLGDAVFEVKNLNGLPALVGRFCDEARGQPPSIAQLLLLDGDGRVRQILSVLATAKLSAVELPRRTVEPSST